MPQNTPEHSPSEEDDSLAELAKSIRAGGGIEGNTFLEDFEQRKKTDEFLSEQELASRIEEIEASIDTLKYSSALERAMYTAAIERMRLRLQMTHGRIDRGDPQNEYDFSVLQDLDRRITYAQYEEDAVDDFLDATEEYEQYRIQFDLDRPVSEGGIPRNNVLEDQLRKQLSSLHTILPRMGDVRKLRYYEFKATLSPENEDVQAKIKQLKGEIPKEFSGSSKLFYDHLEQELRIVLGYTSDVTTPENLTTPTPHLLHRDAIERHFDQVLDRRKQLAGRIGQSAEDEKNSLKEEHAALLDHALNYNIQSVSRLTAIIGHLTNEGHIDQPVQDPSNIESPKQQFGLLGDREAISKERDRKIDDLENYVKHFRTNVLREDRRVDVPIVGSIPLDPSLIIEDLMTTHVIPAKLLLAEPTARGATVWWEAQDMITNAVGLDFDIRESRTQAILSPIYERLGLPDNYSQLTTKQKAEARKSPEVQRRLASVKKIIDEFRANQESVLQGIESDASLLRSLIALKQPSELALVMEPEVPTEMPKLSDLNTDEKIAGAYIFLLERISTTRVNDLNKAQQQFMNKINENLSLNIDVADVEMQLGTVWMREWAMSIGAILGESMAAYYVVRKGLPAALRQTPRLVRGGVRLASHGIDAVRSGMRSARQVPDSATPSRTAPAGVADDIERASGKAVDELTKMRYIDKERQLAQWLEKTRAGRFVSNLKFVQNMKVVRGTGTVLKYGAFVLVPAAGAYEAYLTHERVQSADGNKDLQDVYAENYTTTALETAGYGAGMLLSIGPQIVLAVPIYVAGGKRRARAEVKEGWVRESDDWMREFDSTGLMNKLRKTTLTDAVEAGGGGALYPRVALPSKKDQEEATETIAEGQKGARRNITEAYFKQNLLLPEGTSTADADKIIRLKMEYVGMATEGTYELTSSYIYEEADLYAEIMERREHMNPEDMVISFLDEEGNDDAIDFSRFDESPKNAQEITRQISRYRQLLRPAEELTLMNALGEMAKEEGQETHNPHEVARRLLLSKLSHTIYTFDAIIDDINWPGIDVPFVSSGDSESKNVVRSYVAAKIGVEVDSIIAQALEGDLSVIDYEKALSRCAIIMQDFQSVASGGRERAVYDAAVAYLGESVEEAEKSKTNPLVELIHGT